MQDVRLDKWLWAVRIYKTRSAAATACKKGKITVGNDIAKPASKLKGGEIVFVRKKGFKFQYEVIKLIEKRVSAALAAPCYKDLTPEEELNKYKAWFLKGKGRPEIRDRGAGRPTKKERREIEKFKSDLF